MINSNIMNSDIIAKAEEIKQMVIDRNINSMSWESIFDKYGIYKKELQKDIKSLMSKVEKYVGCIEAERVEE